MNNLFYLGTTALSEPWLPHYRGFSITLRHGTVGRTPLDEWSARGRDLYLTTNNAHKRKTSMPPVGFEFKIPVSGRPPIHALDRAAFGIGTFEYCVYLRQWCTCSVLLCLFFRTGYRVCVCVRVCVCACVRARAMSSVAHPAVQCLSTFSHKQHDFRK